MAQLALTVAGYAIGTAVGQPWLGAFIGGTIGGVVDRKLLFPQDAIQGPRLEDLKVQTSSYGNPIPELWGTMRLAGNVIWAKDLEESSETTGGGCFSGPEVETFNYSATLAIGICRGPIQEVTKIWADTVLIYDSRYNDLGPFPDIFEGIIPVYAKTLNPSNYRLYLGTEIQQPDSWIEDEEGAGLVPAHRGMAYVVFKDFQLEKYSNRIPNFTFEVVKDASYSNPVVPVRATQDSDWPEAPDIFERWTRLHPDGITVVTEAFAINLVTGERWNTASSDYSIGLTAGPGAFDFDEEGYIYGYIYAPGGTSSDGNFHKIDFDLLKKMGEGPLPSVATGPLLDAEGLSGLHIDICKNPQHPYMAWIDLNSNGANLRICRREDLGANNTGFARNGMIFSNVSFDQENGIGWAMLRATGAAPRAVTIVKISPDGFGGFIRQDWDVSANAQGGDNDNFVLFDPTTQQLLLYCGNDFFGGDPSNPNRLYFFDVSSGSPSYLGVLSSSIPIAAPFPASSFLQGAFDGKIYMAAGTDDDVETYRYIEIDIATRAVTNEWYPAAYGESTLTNFLYLPRFNAIFNDWYAGVGLTNPGPHNYYTLVLLDRVSVFGTPLDEIVTDVSELVRLAPADLDVTELTNDVVAGFVLNSKTTGRAALEALIAAYFFDAVEVDGEIVFKKRGGASVATIPEADLGAHISGSERPQLMTTTRQQELELPYEVEVTYVDPEFGYQANVQNERRHTSPSRERLTFNLPISLTADEAKQIAVKLLGYAWRQRERREIAVTKKYLRLAPADIVQVTYQGETVGMRIDDMSLEGGVIRLSLADDGPTAYDSDAAGVPIGTGANPPESEVAAPVATKIAIADVPLIRSSDDGPIIYIGGTGDDPLWPGATVYRTGPTGGNLLSTILGLGTKATIGKAKTALADVADPFVIDAGGSVTVLLFESTASLGSITDAALLAGGNLAILGGEIIQFRDVVDNGDGSFTLSWLLRGRFGSDYATGSHAVGDDFMLVDFSSSRVKPWNITVESRGATLQFNAVTSGDEIENGTIRYKAISLNALKPLSPQHLAGTRDGDDVTFTWIRRTRLGGEWLDGVDVPLGETIEAYEVELYDGATLRRTAQVSYVITSSAPPSVTYTSAQQTADGHTPGDPVTAIVYQISTTVGRGQASAAATA